MVEVKVEEIKYVVNGLNGLLDKKLNVVSYDEMKDKQRIQTLLEVFKKIDPSVRITTKRIITK